MPPNRSSWYSLIWWSRFTTGSIPLITFLNHVHLSILSIMFFVAQARISFIKGGEIPFHFKTGWVDKNPFTATNNDTPAQSAPQEGERRGLIHWRRCGVSLTYLYVCISTDILSLFLLGVYLNSQRSVWHQGHRRPVRVTKNIKILLQNRNIRSIWNKIPLPQGGIHSDNSLVAYQTVKSIHCQEHNFLLLKDTFPFHGTLSELWLFD